MSVIDADDEARRRAMSALAATSPAVLAERFAALGPHPTATPVRGPEVGLVMLRGRIGGGGAPFNVGEATVTRATVRLDTGEIGHAIVLGRDVSHAQAAAHLDALWQRADWRARIDAHVIAPALQDKAASATRRAEETEATRVDFFTLVRGDNP